ncbi:unnamed protein product [Fusarium graminearum]|uniref:Chromosome 3, complete genome n=1 Tax=Gibberella zeae (strain ATCC MYA-4620 / CBS 123657 / FGSC 9075 / NRRL 31084 / PH-1) TaxID=229533 RepID=A0A098E1P7_GIBZE|nr:unnamed protein product [Fusarium graminearum]CZS83474.1 unnamed protein product [Fusarium graminearum]
MCSSTIVMIICEGCSRVVEDYIIHVPCAEANTDQCTPVESTVFNTMAKTECTKF